MVDFNKIFSQDGMGTNIEELILTLANPSVSLDEKRNVWRTWQMRFYSKDELLQFFFDDGGQEYLNVMLNNNYRDFYEMAMGLDMANVDPKIYYLFWILSYGQPLETPMVKDAIDYDPDTIHALLPGIEDVIFFKEPEEDFTTSMQ